METKLVVAIDKLNEEIASPVLYCSRQTVTDENLNQVSATSLPEKKLSINNAVVENVVTGCTTVFSRDLLVFALKAKSVDKIVMHDWWFYLLATTFGQVVFDENSYIYYRQHENNVFGAEANYWRRLLLRIKRFREVKDGKANHWLTQAMYFLELYSEDIPADKLQFLKSLESYNKNFIERILMVFGANAFYRQRFVDNVIFKLMVIFKMF